MTLHIPFRYQDQVSPLTSLPTRSALPPRSASPDFSTSPQNPRRYTKEIFWCAQGTHTYIVATLRPYTGNAHVIQNLLESSFNIIERIMHFHGDGPVDAGDFTWNNFAPGAWLQLSVQNANNHQLTYGVLQAAIDALDDYCTAFGYGLVDALTIYDGSNEVATGTLQPGVSNGHH